MASENQLNPLFGPPCERHEVVTVHVFGTKLLFARRGANQLLRAAMRAYDVDYGVYRIESYNCRPVTGGTSPSAHSWPVAVDVNPDTNAFSSAGVLDTDMPREFVRCFKGEGFGWGGIWTTPKDAMHLSLAPNERGTPHPEDFDERLQRRARRKWREVHGGVDAGLAPHPPAKTSGAEPPPFPGHVLSHERWRRQGKRPDPDVKRFQKRLKQRGWTIQTDGDYTRPVVHVVRAFQREKALRIDGRVGDDTWRAIWEAPIT